MSIVNERLGRGKASWFLLVGLCTYSQLNNSAGYKHTEWEGKKPLTLSSNRHKRTISTSHANLLWLYFFKSVLDPMNDSFLVSFFRCNRIDLVIAPWISCTPQKWRHQWIFASEIRTSWSPVLCMIRDEQSIFNILLGQIDLGIWE